MALAAGTRLGPYEIESAIGAGGMGEVYRARDTKLDRAVAIKILPESFAQDPERLARFAREAKTLAALNHPNIATIHGFEEALGFQGLVMELVEGPTLADRIEQGRIPIDEALPIARQIADALEAAHNQGIIHRDLKPANIKLRPDGTVKVLDFGLAKALSGDERSGVASSLSLSPTITSPAHLRQGYGGQAAMTGMGVILGTASYMAPEQARGKTVDKRADIWAFGCVLYEMLTGRQAFDGAEVTDVLARIIEREPDVAVLPANTPPAIRRLLRRCLEKDRKRRLADVADARLEIDDALTSPAAEAPTNAPLTTRVPNWRKAIPIASVIAAALVAGYGAWALKPAAPLAVTRFAIMLPEGDMFTSSPSQSIALSPDGARLAYTANNRVYLRALDRLDATPIAGGESAPLASPRTPFFSPDGQWIGFWEAAQLKKVSVTGGAPVTLCELTPPPNGASWADDNTILVGRFGLGIWRVSGNGGKPEQIVKVDEGQRAHGPQLLPDGRTVIFNLARTASWDEAEIVAQSLDNGTRQTLVTGGTDGRYLPTGHLVYALRGALLAVPFDLPSLTTRGGPVPVVEGVSQSGRSASANIAVSANGTLAYGSSSSASATLRTLVWVDRAGREEAIPAPPRSYRHPRLSPDGTRLALDFPDDNQIANVWVWDFTRASLMRVTSDPTGDSEPLWTPDGQRLIFNSKRTGEIALFWQAANGSGTAELVSKLTRQSNVAPTISPDGRYLVIRAASQGSSYLALLDLGDSLRTRPPASRGVESRPLLQTAFEEYNSQISPDGRWLAYTSNESGSFDVYVRPFPDVMDGVWRVSTGGGTEPLWATNGRELFYRNPKGAVMRVSITPGTTWTASTPTQLFEAPLYALAPIGNAAVARTYDVSPDGKRFLMMKDVDAPAQTSPAPRIVVVQNWHDELKRLVPTK